jgi:hypothetical protein
MRQPRPRVLHVLGLAALLFGLPPKAAAAGPAPSLASLVARADRIVTAEVLDVRCQAEATRDGDVPITLVTIRTERTLKGAASTHLVLEFLGGTAGADRLAVAGLPRFAVGDRDVLFLRGATRGISPLVATVHGRFRLLASEGTVAVRVADHTGRPLTESDLLSESVSPRRAGSIALSRFEQAVRDIVRLQAENGTSAGPEPTADAAGPMAELPPLRLHVALGPSPALLDSCADWSCAVSHRESFRGMIVSDDESVIDAAAGERVRLTWGRDAFGRELEADAPAVTLRRDAAGRVSTTVIFNDRLRWNSYEGPVERLASGQAVLDLPGVAASELALLYAPEGAAAGTVSSAARRTGPGRAPAAGSRAVALDPREALSGCDPGGVVVDPRLLTFNSADHSMMTSYQVGFFLPGASAASQVVDVSLTSFLIKMVVDLPAAAVQQMQGSLVLDIRRAGLATPIGSVFTYRVRGVWSGGFTSWSDPSQTFVRCTS